MCACVCLRVCVCVCVCVCVGEVPFYPRGVCRGGSLLSYGGCPRHVLSCCSHWDRMEAICCILRKKSSLLPAESWAFFNFMQMSAICCMLRANQFGVCVIWRPT